MPANVFVAMRSLAKVLNIALATLTPEPKRAGQW
jgi:hypothetical protein